MLPGMETDKDESRTAEPCKWMRSTWTLHTVIQGTVVLNLRFTGRRGREAGTTEGDRDSRRREGKVRPP